MVQRTVQLTIGFVAVVLGRFPPGRPMETCSTLTGNGTAQAPYDRMARLSPSDHVHNARRAVRNNPTLDLILALRRQWPSFSPTPR
jgi:hypothetical protein